MGGLRDAAMGGGRDNSRGVVVALFLLQPNWKAAGGLTAGGELCGNDSSAVPVPTTSVFRGRFLGFHNSVWDVSEVDMQVIIVSLLYNETTHRLGRFQYLPPHTWPTIPKAGQPTRATRTIIHCGKSVPDAKTFASRRCEVPMEDREDVFLSLYSTGVSPMLESTFNEILHVATRLRLHYCNNHP